MVSSGMLRCVALVEPTFRKNFVFLRSVRRLLVAVNVVPISPILVTLMMEALSCYETSVLRRTTRRNIPEDAILQSLGRRLNNICIVSRISNAGNSTVGLQGDTSGLHLTHKTILIRKASKMLMPTCERSIGCSGGSSICGWVLFKTNSVVLSPRANYTD
jgi:hypothetical protein